MARPQFDVTVPANGYRWWYVDALSDDGRNGITIIGFIGSVFSPYYRRARKRGFAAAENHCAINVALYGTQRRWAMTERSASHVFRDPVQFTVGPSSLRWVDDELRIEINERCMPVPYAMRGTVRLRVDQFYDAPVKLDDKGKHYWQAVAPHARVDVAIEHPHVSWSGTAYHDINWGDEPLEHGFKNWTWLRTTTPSGTQVLYNMERRDGSQMGFGRGFHNGIVNERKLPACHNLPRGVWGMPRPVHSETTPRLIATLEDAPFYTRNHIAMKIDGIACEAFHESLSLDRFVNPAVQMMLPFRMPRVG